MLRLVYLLEDYFSDIAEKRRGRLGGLFCRGLSRVLGNIGDLLQVTSFRRH